MNQVFPCVGGRPKPGSGCSERREGSGSGAGQMGAKDKHGVGTVSQAGPRQGKV